MSNRLKALLNRFPETIDSRIGRKLAKITADLRILISMTGKSMKEVAAITQQSPAALSQKLDANSNLQLSSILKIADAVGYDFDVIFREQGAARIEQSWEVDRARELIGSKVTTSSINSQAALCMITYMQPRAVRIPEASNKQRFHDRLVTEHFAMPEAA